MRCNVNDVTILSPGHALLCSTSSFDWLCLLYLPEQVIEWFPLGKESAIEDEPTKCLCSVSTQWRLVTLFNESTKVQNAQR